MRTLILAFILLSSNAFAGWSTNYVKDEMRGTQVEVTDIWVEPINGRGPKLYVSVQKLDGGKGQYGIVFSLDDRHQKIDCEKYCQIALRLDEHLIVEDGFVSTDDGFIMPTYPTSLVRAMSMADNMIIEMPSTDGDKYQYRINMSGFDIKIPANPQFNIAGLTIGSDASTLPVSFTQAKSPNCFEATDVGVGEGSLKIPKVFTCVVKNKIASVSFASPKRDVKRFNEFLSKQFGKADKSGEKTYSTIRWPKNDSLIRKNTVSAFVMADHYYINDDSLRYFEKKSN